MSTRTHWAGPNGHRSCAHGRTALHREVSEAEFLRLSNLCRMCERIAQKEQKRRDAIPLGLAAYERTVHGIRQTVVVAHFGIGKLVTDGQLSINGEKARFLIQDTTSIGALSGTRPDADIIPGLMYEWRFESLESLENIINLLRLLCLKWKARSSNPEEKK